MQEQSTSKESGVAGLESPPEAPVSPREEIPQPMDRLEKVVSPQNIPPTTTTSTATGSHPPAGHTLMQSSVPMTTEELTRAVQSPVNLLEQPKMPVPATCESGGVVVAPQPVYPTTTSMPVTTTSQTTVMRQLSGGQGAAAAPGQADAPLPVTYTTEGPDVQPSQDSATGQQTTYMKQPIQQAVVPVPDPTHPSSVPVTQAVTAKQQLLAGQQQQAASSQQASQPLQGVQQTSKMKHAHNRQTLVDLDQKLSKLHNKKQPQPQKSAFSQPPAPQQQFIQQAQPPLAGGMIGAQVPQAMPNQAGQAVFGLQMANQMQLLYLQQQGIPMGAYYPLSQGVDNVMFYGQSPSMQQFMQQKQQQHQQQQAYNQGFMLPQQQQQQPQGMPQTSGIIPPLNMQQQQQSLQQQSLQQQQTGMPTQQMSIHQQQNQLPSSGLHQPAPSAAGGGVVSHQQNAPQQTKQGDPPHLMPNQSMEASDVNIGETVLEGKDSPSHQPSKPAAATGGGGGVLKDEAPPLKVYIPPAKQDGKDSAAPSRFTVQKVPDDQSQKDQEAVIAGSESEEKMSSSVSGVKAPEKEQKIGRFQVSKQVVLAHDAAEGEVSKPKHEAEAAKNDQIKVEAEAVKVAKGRFQVSKVEEKTEELKRKESLTEKRQLPEDLVPELSKEETIESVVPQPQLGTNQGLFADSKSSVQGSDRGTPDSFTSEGSSIPAPVSDLTALQGVENINTVPRPDSAQSVKSTTSQTSLPGTTMHTPPVLERTNSSPNSTVSRCFSLKLAFLSEVDQSSRSDALHRYLAFLPCFSVMLEQLNYALNGCNIGEFHLLISLIWSLSLFSLLFGPLHRRKHKRLNFLHYTLNYSNRFSFHIVSLLCLHL